CGARREGAIAPAAEAHHAPNRDRAARQREQDKRHRKNRFVVHSLDAPSISRAPRIFTPTPQSLDCSLMNRVWRNKLIAGDCLKVLPRVPDHAVDLIVTSPPYADQRKSTYGGVPIDRYVEWFT